VISNDLKLDKPFGNRKDSSQLFLCYANRLHVCVILFQRLSVIWTFKNKIVCIALFTQKILRRIEMKRNYIFIFNLRSAIKCKNFFLVTVTQRNFSNPVSKSNKAQDNFRNCGDCRSCALQNKLHSAQLKTNNNCYQTVFLFSFLFEKGMTDRVPVKDSDSGSSLVAETLS